MYKPTEETISAAFGDKKFFGGRQDDKRTDDDVVSERDLMFLKLIASRIKYLKDRGLPI